ncbi:MAG: type IV secretion system DNA-binding domain-containing protein [Candidatus Saccharibacteria bacterium]|nr:type IV secretion system DNA-binding domain-containing protein [Candidatus Saccharibacteria bacterium]
MKVDQAFQILEIMAPAWHDKKPLATEKLFKALHHIQWLISENTWLTFFKASPKFNYSLEIIADKNQIRFRWLIPKPQIETITNLLLAYCPEFQLQIITNDLKLGKDSQYQTVINFDLKTKLEHSLNTPSELYEYDPLSYLTGSLTKLLDEELIIYQLLIRPVKKPASWLNQNYKSFLGLGRLIFSLLGKIASWLLSLNNPHHPKTQNISTPIDSPIFQTNIRLLIKTPDKNRLEAHQQSLISALSLFNSKQRQLKAYQINQDDQLEAFHDRQFKTKLLYLNTKELASLYHFPHSKVTSFEKMPRFLSKRLPPIKPLEGEKSQSIILGDNLYHQKRQALSLSAQERARHMYIVGATGSGKTSFLKHLIIQDIQAHRGLAVIDPHGDLAEEIIQHIPKPRFKDVIYFEPSNLNQKIKLNLLKLPDNLSPQEQIVIQDLRTEHLISVLRKVFYQSEFLDNHRIEYILRNTIQTAYTVLDPDLFTLFKLLNDNEYNRRIVRNLDNAYLKMFWQQEMNRAGGMQKVKMQAGATAKIGRFIFSPSVSSVFSAGDGYNLDLRKIINQKKILICNFSKGQLGEDSSKLFSASLLAQIQLAILEQVQRKENQRPAFYLYVDEFQNFASQSFIDMLSEARKYGLNLIMAQQSLQQNKAHLTDIILANSGNLIIFKTGSPADAKILLPLFEPLLSLSDIINQPAYNFYARLNGLTINLPTSGITKLVNSPSQTITKTQILKATDQTLQNLR